MHTMDTLILIILLIFNYLIKVNKRKKKFNFVQIFKVK